MAARKRKRKPAKVKKPARPKAGKKLAARTDTVAFSEAEEDLEQDDEPSLELQLRRTIAELGLSEARRIFAVLEQTFSR